MHSKDAGRVLITTRTTAHRHHRRLAKLNNTRKARQVIAEARDLLGGNGILLENHIIRHMGDFEASTNEGTEAMQTLIVGRDTPASEHPRDRVDAKSSVGRSYRPAASVERPVDGAASIDDCDVLRAGRTRRLLRGWLAAPSTLGTFPAGVHVRTRPPFSTRCCAAP